MKETPKQKEYRVLRMIYDLEDEFDLGWIEVSILAEKLAMKSHDLFDTLNELQRLGFLEDGIDEASKISATGRKQIERTLEEPESGTGYFPSNIANIVIIHGDNSGPIQAGGQNNSQRTSSVNNPEFSAAVSKLLELVQSAKVSEEDKEDLLSEIKSIQKLASKEKTPDTVERSMKKLECLKLGLEAASLEAAAAQYLSALIHTWS